MSWALTDVPDLTGRRALVTGVTSGIGEKVALELARRGAEVVLAARSPDRLARAAADICGRVRQARVRCLPFVRTPDGFELQLATNHLGPFALTGLLLPRLAESGAGRVVSTASQAHRMARRAPLADPRAQTGRYSRWQAYAESKLANLLFTFELDRRLRAAGLPVTAVAAHPGYASTGLMGAGRRLGGPTARGWLLDAVFRAAGRPADAAALPTLMAATADLPGGSYVGPGSMLQLWGPPRTVGSTRRARDPHAQERLWQISEDATGVRFP